MLLVLLCFVSLLAPGALTLWAALLLGLIADALAGTPIVGPHALGFMLGAYLVLQLRGLVFRESVFTLAFMTLAAGVFVHLAAVALLAVRGLPLTPGEAHCRASSAADRARHPLLRRAVLGGDGDPGGLAAVQDRAAVAVLVESRGERVY